MFFAKNITASAAFCAKKPSVLGQNAIRFGPKCNPFWAKTPPVLWQNAELATIPLGYTPRHKHPPTVKMAGAEGELRQG